MKQISNSQNNNNNSFKAKNTPVAPDGGYGWVVVIALSLQVGASINIIPLFADLYGPKFEKFQATETEKSSVLAAFLIFAQGVSLFVGPLVQVSSERIIGMIGATLQTLGVALSAISTATWHLILCIGVVTGIGFGISIVNNIIIINKYFNKKIGIAMGLAASLLSIIGLILPQILKILLPNFEIQTVIFIYSAFQGVTSVLGAILMKPLDNYSAVSKDLSEENQENFFRRCLNFWKRVFSLIEWSLLKQPYFLFITMVNCICMINLQLQLSEISQVAKERNFTLEERADIISILSVADIFTKVATGVIMDMKILKKLFDHPMKMLYIFHAAGMGITMIGLAYANSFAEMAFFVCIASFFNSNILINFSQILR